MAAWMSDVFNGAVPCLCVRREWVQDGSPERMIAKSATHTTIPRIYNALNRRYRTELPLCTTNVNREA